MSFLMSNMLTSCWHDSTLKGAAEGKRKHNAEAQRSQTPHPCKIGEDAAAGDSELRSNEMETIWRRDAEDVSDLHCHGNDPPTGNIFERPA